MSSYPSWTGEDIERAVADGAAAAADWGRQPLSTRTAAVRRLATQLRQAEERFAALITAELGKPLAEAAGELEKSTLTAEYYADHAEAILGDEQVHVDGVDVLTVPVEGLLGATATGTLRVPARASGRWVRRSSR